MYARQLRFVFERDSCIRPVRRTVVYLNSSSLPSMATPLNNDTYNRQQFVLLQWTKDKGFSWSILPRQDVYPSGNDELHAGMIVKAKWISSRLEAKVLAYDGKLTCL